METRYSNYHEVEVDPVEVAERYWHDMRREMHLAIKLEEKAFRDYQDVVARKPKTH